MTPQEEQSYRDAYNQGGLTAFSKALATPDYGKLNSTLLTPEPKIDYAKPELVPPYPVKALDPNIPENPMQMTGSEKKADDLSAYIQSLNVDALGESSFRAQQEGSQGLPDLYKTQTDLSSKLKALQNEALAIPQQLQLDATGRGITKGGLAPIETAKLRNNAIQALGVNSLLAASQGNIATAQTMVDRAVAQKFDPIKERIAAATKNLELILKSPSYSLEEKNRAQAQLEIQQAKQIEVEKQARLEEENRKGVLSVYQDAAKAGASQDVINGIGEAETQEEALRIAAQFGVYQMAEQKELALNGFVKITGPSQLKGLTEDQILRMPNGDIYKKPAEKINTATTTKYINGVAHTVLFDQQTGKIISDLGVSEKPEDKTPSISEQLAANEAGFDIDKSGKLIGKPIDTALGQATITGYGSDKWSAGLDLVVAGGKGASITTPFSGTVISAKNNGGFGNQVKIRTEDGNEVWMSHLQNINVKVGDTINSGTIIGTQGNTGNVYSNNGGDGTHLDLTIKKPDGGFFNAKEVASLIGAGAGALSSLAKKVAEGKTKLSSLTKTEATKVEKELADAGVDIPKETNDLTIVNQLADDVRQDPDVKDFITIRDGFERVKQGETSNSAQGDLALLFGYMKLLDPNSVVRETEFANAEQAQGTLQRWMNLPNKFLSGERLTDEARKHFAKSAQELYERKKKSYDNAIDYWTERAKKSDVEPEMILRDFGSTIELADEQKLTDEEAYKIYLNP